MPAAIAITPNRIEIAYTVDSSSRKTISDMISQNTPATRNTHHAFETVRATSAAS